MWVFIDCLRGWGGEVAEFYAVGLYDEVEDDLFPAVGDDVARQEQEGQVVAGKGYEEHASMKNSFASDKKQLPEMLSQG